MKRAKVIGAILLSFCYLLALSAQEVDFLKEMGKGTIAWEYLETQEDYENLSFYKKVFEEQYVKSEESEELGNHDKIPFTFHFIWLGPKDLPEESKKNIASWLKKHPHWSAKLWTDKDRGCDLPGVETVLITEYPFRDLSPEYYEADNYGEKSQILRYEILFDEGGVYIDHDVACVQPFDPLMQKYDFFAGLEPLSVTYLSSSVYPSTSVIGCKPGHPILAAAIQWLQSHWAAVTLAHPGTQEENVVSRIKHRSFAALEQGVKYSSCLNGNRDIVFPSTFFDSESKERAIYATHSHLGTWHKKSYPLEKKLERYSAEIKEKNALIEILIYVISSIQVVVLALLATLWKFIKKGERRKL